MQSQTLGIPDRFGLFSGSGSARLQAYEGHSFFFLIWFLWFMAFCFGLLTILAVKLPLGIPILLPLTRALAVLGGALAVLVYIVELFDHRRRRAPDYDWGEEWKVRTE